MVALVQRPAYSLELDSIRFSDGMAFNEYSHKYGSGGGGERWMKLTGNAHSLLFTLTITLGGK